MADRRRRWVPIAVGIAFLCLCLIIGMVVVVTTVFRENVAVTESTDTDATAAFDEVRRRFAGQPALLEMRDGEPHRVSGDRPRSTVELQSMKILAWDPTDNELARITLPFWLLRLKREPIEFGTYIAQDDVGDDGSPLDVEDLEAHGPGLVLDHTTSRGHRVLVWLE